MTIHYHGMRVSPLPALMELAGRHFCVSHVDSSCVRRCHEIGQSVMLDNGAFSKWKSGKQTNWEAFYAWCDVWLDCPSTWAVPPDVIDAPVEEQDRLLREWPHGKRQAAPVWHMNEPIIRLTRLIDDGWSRVCVGSTAEFAQPLTPPWRRRMDEIWEALELTYHRPPPLHMLRGLACTMEDWPFLSVDSTDIARNHHLKGKTPRAMADRWDALNTPVGWPIRLTKEDELR